MHPEMLREMTDQRGREMRARARQSALARLAIRATRRGRSRPDEADEFALPAIPDYVDGSFRPGPASTEAVASEAGQAPATHHTA
jgi:hypothetical protein